MHDIPELIDGYRRFLSQRYPQEATTYRSLAEVGQTPKTMVIGCCDSRVDPAAIFSAGPGQLFVVRNVANLVPPYAPDGEYHGTSAAVEFAVTGLEVENIVVLGHGRCGGVRAFLDGLYGNRSGDSNSFIDKWISLLHAARADVEKRCAGTPIETWQQEMEHASVRQSIENLKSFPFVHERVTDGRLRLRGAYFDIADGRLMALDPASGEFTPAAP